MKPNIGIIGNGFVGNAMVRGFILDAYLKIYDKYKPIDSLEETVKKSDYIFLCLPTPMKNVDGGEIDLTVIDGVIEEIAPMVSGSRKIVIIKSTVIPGTTQNYAEKYPEIRFCFCPEFLTARQAYLDFINAARHIFGGPPDITHELEQQVFKPRFPSGNFFHTDYTSAEMAKYMSNLFFATKISFCNEFYDIIQHFGLNYNEIISMVLADGRIANSHTTVPGHEDKRGFGGTCFPKDLNAIIHLCNKIGIPTDILDAAWNVNKRVRPRKDWDWADNKSAVSNPKRHKIVPE